MYEVNPGEIGFDSSLRGFELSEIDCTCVRTRKLRDHRNPPQYDTYAFSFLFNFKSGICVGIGRG